MGTHLYAADKRRLERLRDRQRRLDEQRLAVVRELTAKGISARQIAGPLGVKSHTTILSWLKEDERAAELPDPTGELIAEQHADEFAGLREDILNFENGHPMEDA